MYNFKDFSDALKYNLDNFEGDYPSFINWGPNLFDLLSSLLDQKEINNDFKLQISAAIAYYVVPNDIIPEEIYGPYGYVDDIFISLNVLQKEADTWGYDFLQEIWNNDDNVNEVIDICYIQSIEILGDKVKEILNYVGLV